MKVINFCFVISYLFLATSPIFCAKITIINNSGVTPINIGQNKIDKSKTIDISSPFDIEFSTDENNFSCKNIPILDGTQYNVNKIGNKFNVNSNQKINAQNQWDCKQLPPKFKVKNSIPNTTAYVWLGAEEGFKDIGTQKNVKNVKIESTNKDITVFGLHIDVNNSTQKIKCNDIRIENGKQYVINNNNGIITVNEQQNSCYLVGKITIENNVSELTDKFKVNTRIPGGNSIDIDLTSDRNTQNFTITLTPTTEKTYTLKVTAFPGITKYEIKKDANSNYVLVAGNQTIPFVKK